MKTELELVYGIINVARNAEHNNDEAVPERLVRAFIRTHRADSLRKHYKNGHFVDDEVFQNIPIRMVKVSDNEYQYQLPKIIRFPENTGFYIEKTGVVIPIVESEQYNLQKKNDFSKNFLFCKTEEGLITLYVFNMTGNTLDATSDNAMFLQLLADDLYAQQVYNYNNPLAQLPIGIDLNLHAVLLDPSDAPNYDWEVDMFPFPSERLVELENQVLAKEFGIMASTKKDEIQNARADDVKYNDNSQLNNGQ